MRSPSSRGHWAVIYKDVYNEIILFKELILI